MAFGRMNFILLAVSMAIVVIGFILMSGPGSTETTFVPDIFSARRIKVAPVVCLFGFVSMIFAVMYRGKDNETTAETSKAATETSKAAADNDNEKAISNI